MKLQLMQFLLLIYYFMFTQKSFRFVVCNYVTQLNRNTTETNSIHINKIQNILKFRISNIKHPG